MTIRCPKCFYSSIRIDDDVRRCMRCRLLFNPKKVIYDPRAEKFFAEMKRVRDVERLVISIISLVGGLISSGALLYLFFRFVF